MQALESAGDRVARHQAREPPLAEAVSSARELLAQGERWFEKCGDLQERIGSTEAGLARRKRETAEITARLGAAQRELQGARENLQRAEQELGDARQANAAAAAAHGLCPGDECPVCRSEILEDWVAPRDMGLDAAREAHRQAGSRANAAGRVVAEAEAQQQSGRERIGEARRYLGDLRSEIDGALGQLGSAAGLGDALPLAAAAPLPDREEVLAPARQRFREAETKLDRHRTEAKALREVHTSAQVEEASARHTLTHMRNDLGRTRNTAHETLDALNRNIQSIPSPFRPRLILPPNPVELETVDTAPVDRASSAAREREEILQLRSRERDHLRAGIEETRTARTRLGEIRRTRIEEPLQALVRGLANHRTALAEAVRDLAAETEVPAALHYPVDARTLRDGIGRLRRAMADVIALGADLRRHALAAAEEAHAEARKVAAQLEPPADPADIERLALSAGEAATEAGYTARAATETRDAFAAILDDLLKLRRTADEVAALELALSDLDAALKPGAFLKWLTLRRSRDLLVYASVMLQEMTASRYSFADPGDLEDQQWLVVDNDSGKARSPASLSGGEQFIGSLALALGMVEMMSRSGGRLESLFLDEGFGSLDRNNLDCAIEALSQVAGTGRMVGVISHVGAVAERIDAVLAVTRGATGSRATWLSRAQRQELARSDTGLEEASALSGLLD